MSTIRPGFLYEWMYIISPIEPSVKAGLNTGMLFCGKEGGGRRGQREEGEAVRVERERREKEIRGTYI